MEKDAELGDRALDYLYVLADRYYKEAESSAETPPDTANELNIIIQKQEKLKTNRRCQKKEENYG